ncbi:MAG: ABC transporter permease [Verrucomicrobia bacterium]|nr:ABC transporter permease [Verrucomicrobiota bacterium]
MTSNLAYQWRLFTTLTWTNFKMRYYGSILGYVWSLLKPLAMFGVLYIVFTVVMKQSAPHYKLFLLLGIIIWDFFVQGTMAGMNGFIGNYQMIRKVYLPRIILVMAAVSGAFIGFFFNLIVFLVFALLDGVDWSLRMLWFIPLVIALYLLVMGIGLILSIVVVKVRDTLSLWEVVTQLGFWFTPVMYPMSNVPEKYRFFEFLNPMSGILEYSRYVLIGLGGLSKLGYCYVLGVSLLVFFLGIAVFKWKEGEMVEDL